MFQVKSNARGMDLMRNSIVLRRKELERKFVSRNRRNKLPTNSNDNSNSLRYRVKMLSVIDVNDRKCQVKGTSLPKQYERYPLILNQTESIRSTETADSDIIKRLKEMTQNNSKEIKYKPKELLFHDLFLKEPALIDQDLISKHPFMKKLPLLTINEIRKKHHDSNVFNPSTDHIRKEEENYHGLNAPSPNRYNETDVFCLKDNKKNSLMKNYPPYSIVQQSGSEWTSSNPLPSFMNYSSVKWNPLNAQTANVALTKQLIISKGLRTDLNTFHRQKGISEFVDITRIGASRTNKSMQDWLEQTKGDFKKSKGICSEHGDVYKSYQGLVAQPFTKALY